MLSLQSLFPTPTAGCIRVDERITSPPPCQEEGHKVPLKPKGVPSPLPADPEPPDPYPSDQVMAHEVDNLTN